MDGSAADGPAAKDFAIRGVPPSNAGRKLDVIPAAVLGPAYASILAAVTGPESEPRKSSTPLLVGDPIGGDVRLWLFGETDADADAAARAVQELPQLS